MEGAERDDAASALEGDGSLSEGEPTLPARGERGGQSAEEEYADDVTRERDELLETLRRVQADFENFRKRTLREQTERIERATEQLIGQLLPVLDSFELALENAGSDPETERLRKGVELVFTELVGTLEKGGLRRIDADGKPFDPTEHEAVMQIEGAIEGEPVVAETVRTGYLLKDRVLRPAMVKVAHR